MFIRIKLYNNWHNLFEQFPYISRTNFDIIILIRKYKKWKRQFSYIFPYCDFMKYLYIK